MRICNYKYQLAWWKHAKFQTKPVFDLITLSFSLGYGLKLIIYTAATIILQTDICYGIPQPSRSAEIIRDVIIISSITFPIIALRFVSRSLVSNKLWLDDWAVIAATVRRHGLQPTVAFTDKLNRS